MQIHPRSVSGFFLLLAPSAAQTAHAAPPTDARSLLTPVQVNAVLGITAKPGHSVPDDTSVCDWPLASLAKMILDAQTWSVITPPANAAAQVNGIGGYAVYLGNGDLVSLYVKKGNTKFSVNVHGFPLDQIEAKEKTLAEEITAKL